VQVYYLTIQTFNPRAFEPIKKQDKQEGCRYIARAFEPIKKQDKQEGCRYIAPTASTLVSGSIDPLEFN